MPDALVEYLERDMECEGLLECLHGLKPLDRVVFQELVEATDPLTVDELAERVDRERSTAYRSVQRLRDEGLVQKEQMNYEEGGYYHVYSPSDAEQVSAEMQRLLNEWYASMGQLVHEFREKYIEETQSDPDAVDD